MQLVEWKEELRKLKDLKPHKRNPRRISSDAFDALVEDILTSGYHNRIKINTDNMMISGHQRKRALLDPRIGYKPSDEIPVLVPPRTLTEAEFKAQVVIDNAQRGEWDFEILSADYDAHELVAYGLSENLVGVLDCEEDQEELEQKPKKKVKLCQECGAEQ